MKTRSEFSGIKESESGAQSAGMGREAARETRLTLSLTVLLCLAAMLIRAAAPVGAEPSVKIVCGNLIYAGSQSSVCFADRFLSDVARETSLKVDPKFSAVRLDSDALFDHPFCVWSGNESFTLTKKERENLRKYLLNGGFLLVSPGCSDEKWDKSFRTEMKLVLPEAEYGLNKLPMNHPVFSVVNQIPRLTDKHGKQALLEGIEIHGRLALVHSAEGLNDVANAKGCCCCGGNEIANPARVNVNVMTYSLLH